MISSRPPFFRACSYLTYQKSIKPASLAFYPIATTTITPPRPARLTLRIAYVSDATLTQNLIGMSYEALTFYFPADVAAVTRSKSAATLDL